MEKENEFQNEMSPIEFLYKLYLEEQKNSSLNQENNTLGLSEYEIVSIENFLNSKKENNGEDLGNLILKEYHQRNKNFSIEEKVLVFRYLIRHFATYSQSFLKNLDEMISYNESKRRDYYFKEAKNSFNKMEKDMKIVMEIIPDIDELCYEFNETEKQQIINSFQRTICQLNEFKRFIYFYEEFPNIYFSLFILDNNLREAVKNENFEKAAEIKSTMEYLINNPNSVTRIE